MGVVYLAQRTGTDDLVALKVLRPDLYEQPRARERFRRERIAAARVDHPGICPVLHVGDAVLKEFAQRLRRNIRGVDLACRFGGEEFVVLMPDIDYRQAEGVAERVRTAVAERGFETSGARMLTVTCSVGVALNEHELDTPEMILKRADVALYRAKREGRNRVVFDAA